MPHTIKLKQLSPIKGRGAVSAPVGRFEERHSESCDDGWGGAEEAAASPAAATTVHADAARTLINRNRSPDTPFSLSINPYRGCEHGCIYCYARPSHAYLGLSPGIDFETQLFAKHDAVKLLRRELARRNYKPETISLGSNTDIYQPIERKLRLTRGILETLAECRHPLWMITKATMIERDLDLLADLAGDNLVNVSISITSLDGNLTRTLEPRAASPKARLRSIEKLAAGGVPVSVLMAPIIPAINDNEIETLLKTAADAGAVGAGYTVLRLPNELKEVFDDWLQAHMPLRAEKVKSLMRQLHGGHRCNAGFFERQRGSGVWGDLIRQRFERAKRACGLAHSRAPLNTELFRPPQDGAQGALL